MKFYSTLSKKVKVITKNATPYEVEGNKGITYRLVILNDNDVEKIKVIDEKTYTEFEPGKDYLLTCEFDIRNGRCGDVKVNGFVPFK
nr:hypothetical protein [uncultured Blautia sp.]